ncbi:Haloalkane dehalogenase 3 [Seminavis robusta]|uniref:Haloalkane dehalogenase 3 n=1 Tax=Seminavis robusta TaxID=568900 RepID=A0A9N8EDD9_9STRA|nr:Haloalkane dehalogenase 3 [Seminavis robusta]|eukprot:Sro839_g209290.1 Haloalkane dehalogenase 3 (124) ;mRNA; f:30382-30753
MGENDIPKLHVTATPGLALFEGGDLLELARTWKNQKEVNVAGIHFIQEDSAAEIATAIDDWLLGDEFLGSLEVDPALLTTTSTSKTGGSDAGTGGSVSSGAPVSTGGRFLVALRCYVVESPSL